MNVDSLADNPWLAREPRPLSQPYRTIEDIRADHLNEWVLVVGSKVDRSNNVVGGRVTASSASTYSEAASSPSTSRAAPSP